MLDSWPACARRTLHIPTWNRHACTLTQAMAPPTWLATDAQDEDQRARYFHFRKQRTELMWAQLHSVELDDLMATNSTSQLDTVRVFACSTANSARAFGKERGV